MGHFGSFPLYYETSSDETLFSSHMDPVMALFYPNTAYDMVRAIWPMAYTEKADWWKRAFSKFLSSIF